MRWFRRKPPALPSYLQARLDAGLCIATQKTPGSISCFDRCDLPLDHEGNHKADYGEYGVREFTDSAVATSWRVSSHEWGAMNGMWPSREKRNG